MSIVSLASQTLINYESCLLCIWLVERYFCDVVYGAFVRYAINLASVLRRDMFFFLYVPSSGKDDCFAHMTDA